MMQYQEWQDLIPFYVAKTLSIEERRAFEAFLKARPEFQRDIDDWHVIAGAVWEETDTNARRLPPLSPDIYQKLAYRSRSQLEHRNQRPPRNPTVRRTNAPVSMLSLPVTLAAGFVVALVFGGVLVFSGLRLQQQNIADLQIAQNATQTQSADVAAPNTDDPLNNFAETTPIPPPTRVTVTPTTIPETPTPTNTVAVIIPPTQYVPPPTIYVPPTSTNLPFGMGGGGGDASDTSMIIGTPAPDMTCRASNLSQTPVNVHRSASTASPITGTIAPGGSRRAHTTSGTGWIEVLRPEDQTGPILSGWVNSSLVILVGDCAVIPQASPTNAPEQVASPTATLSVNSLPPSIGRILRDNVPYYPSPNSQTPTGMANTDQTFRVNAQTTYFGTLYYRIMLDVSVEAWILGTDILVEPVE